MTNNTGSAVMEEFTFTDRRASWVKLVSSEAGGYGDIEVYYDECMEGNHEQVKTFLLGLTEHYN